MDPKKIEYRLGRINQILIIGCLALAVLFGVALSTDWLTLTHSEQVAAQPYAKAGAASFSSAVERETVDRATRGKAIFRTLRVLAPRVVDDSGRFQLTGTSVRDGKWRAYVKDTKLKQTHTLYEGDILGGRYEVLSIQKDSIELRRGGEVSALRK